MSSRKQDKSRDNDWEEEPKRQLTHRERAKARDFKRGNPQ